MQQRLEEAASEKASRERLQEEVESSARAITKLKERQDVLSAASGTNVSATEWQLREERDKLLVSCRVDYAVLSDFF